MLLLTGLNSAFFLNIFYPYFTNTIYFQCYQCKLHATRTFGIMKRRTKFLTQYLFFSIFFSYNAWTEGNLLVCYLGTAWHYMKQKILRLFFNIYYGFYFKVLAYMFLLHFDEICSKILRVMLLNRRSITGNNVILFYVQSLYPTVGFVNFFVSVSLQRCAHKYKQYVVKHPCELYD